MTSGPARIGYVVFCLVLFALGMLALDYFVATPFSHWATDKLMGISPWLIPVILAVAVTAWLWGYRRLRKKGWH